jgi:RHS repeat-associated protein
MTKDDNKQITSILYNQLNLPTQIVFNNDLNTKICYLYTATGQKVQKSVYKYYPQITANLMPAPAVVTDYLGGYQYIDATLQFFPHAEGYIKYTEGVSNPFDYVYNYTDHLGNIRLSYGADPANPALLKKYEENNYYPFGLKHKEYNNALRIIVKAEPVEAIASGKKIAIFQTDPLKPITTISNSSYNYKYQGQERQDELGLNWDSFKWRNYDFAIGRFMSIDPLSEKYSYQSHYNFSENRVVDGRELEGLEWASIKNQDGSTTRQVTVQLYNNSSLNDKQIAKTTEAIKEQFVKSFSGVGGNAEIIIQNVSEAKGDFSVTLVDVQSNIIYDRETGEEISRGYNAGEAGKLGETKNNSFEVVATADGSKRSDSSIARTFSHELGHTAGLEHPWQASNPVGDIKQGEKGVLDKTVRNNLMNSDQNPTNPSNSGTQLTTGQLKSVDELINNQQN